MSDLVPTLRHQWESQARTHPDRWLPLTVVLDTPSGQLLRTLHLPHAHPSLPPDPLALRLGLASLLNLLVVWGPQKMTLHVPPQGRDLADTLLDVLRTEGATALLMIQRFVGRPIRLDVSTEPAPPVETFTWPPPPPELPLPPGLLIGIDVGGTDIKVAIHRPEGDALFFDHRWRVAPSDFPVVENWAEVLGPLVKLAHLYGSVGEVLKPDPSLEDITHLLEAGAHVARTPVAALGLGMPELVRDGQIRAGFSGKVLGIVSTYGGRTEACFEGLDRGFGQLVRGLSHQVGDVPLFVATDGILAALAPPFPAGGATLRLALGTSITAGFCPENGLPPEIPLYVSALQINLEADPGSEHDSLGLPGVAQKGPTQKGLFRRAHLAGLVDPSLNTRQQVERWKEDTLTSPPLASLFGALGHSLNCVVDELAWCLGVGSARVEVVGRLVDIKSHGDGADILLKAAGLNGNGTPPSQSRDPHYAQASGALELARLGLRGGWPPLSAQARRLANIQRSQDLRLGNERSYDLLLVTAANPLEAEICHKRLAELLVGPFAPHILVLTEDWPGGAGNLLGTLYAWQGARDRLHVERPDLFTRWEQGDLKVALIHNGGDGRRASPLPQVEEGSRGAILLPGEMEPGPNSPPWRLLTAVTGSILPLAQSLSPQQMDVFWASQLFFGTQPHLAPSPFLLTKFCAPVAAGGVPSPLELRDLGLFGLSSAGEVLAFASQGSFSNTDEYLRWSRQFPQVAFDLGSFRISYPLLHHLADTWAPVLASHTTKRDLDPHFLQPLVQFITALRGSPTPPGEPEVLNLAKELHLEEIGDLWWRGYTLAPLERWIGVCPLGIPLWWQRLRRPEEWRTLALSLLGGPFTRDVRLAFGISHPVTRSWLGEVWIEGPELTWEEVEAGVDIGGTWLRRVVLREVRLGPGSRCQNSVLEEVAGTIHAEGSWVRRVVTGHLTAQDAVVYEVIKPGESLEVRGEILAEVMRGELGGPIPVRCDLHVDGKSADELLIGDNTFTFRQLRQALATRKDMELRQRRFQLGWETALPPISEITRHIKAEISGQPTGETALSPTLGARLAQLVEAAGSDDPARSRPTAGALFGEIIEWLNDDLSLERRQFSAKILFKVWELAATHPRGRIFRDTLLRAGYHQPGQLEKRYQQLTKRPPTLPPGDIHRVLVLPRVSLGAEIAINTTVLRALSQALPQAELVMLGDVKLAPLLHTCPHTRLLPFRFDRRGGLFDRLEAWVDLYEQVAALRPDLVIGPNSRLDQLGTLPLPVADDHYLYWEDALHPGEEAAPHGDRITRWLQRWLEEKAREVRPTLWLDPALIFTAEQLASRLQLHPEALVSIKFDVGGQNSKSPGLDFEVALVKSLLQAGRQVILDRGFSPDELAHTRALLTACGDVSVVEVTDLPGGIGVPWQAPLPPLPHPGLVIFHGSLGGWAALSHLCPRAFSYDSVHQHLASASLLTPSGERPGAATTVLFAGYPHPTFTRVWCPTSLAPVTVLTADMPPSELLQACLHTL